MLLHKFSNVLLNLQVIDKNDVSPQFVFPSASDSLVKLEWPVAPHAVVASVHTVDYDSGNAGVVSVSLADRSRGGLFDVRPNGEVRVTESQYSYKHCNTTRIFLM